jgi:hypothetical protein
MLEATYNKLPWRRNAMGAAGSMMVRHAFGTSTLLMALRVTFLRFDFDPRVATSLRRVSRECTTSAGGGSIPDCCDAVLARGEDCGGQLCAFTTPVKKRQARYIPSWL